MIYHKYIGGYEQRDLPSNSPHPWLMAVSLCLTAEISRCVSLASLSRKRIPEKPLEVHSLEPGVIVPRTIQLFIAIKGRPTCVPPNHSHYLTMMMNFTINHGKLISYRCTSFIDKPNLCASDIDAFCSVLLRLDMCEPSPLFRVHMGRTGGVRQTSVFPHEIQIIPGVDFGVPFWYGETTFQIDWKCRQTC